MNELRTGSNAVLSEKYKYIVYSSLLFLCLYTVTYFSCAINKGTT